MKQSIEIECRSCRGTGLYSGFAEPKGVAVVCVHCEGTGKEIFEYEPFTGRKPKKGIKTVKCSQGAFVFSGVGPDGDSITYEEFQNGKFPAYKNQK